MSTVSRLSKNSARILKTGDSVAFSAAFMRSTQRGYECAQMRGVVTQTDGVFPRGFTDSYGDNLEGEPIPESCCLVSWDNNPPRMVATFNLARVGSLSFAEAPYTGRTYIE